MEIAIIPPPIRGLNTSSMSVSLAPEEAIVFENWFAERNYVRLRKGIVVYTGEVIGTGDIKTVTSFCNEGGATKKLLALANAGVYDISTSTPASVALPEGYATVTTDYWDSSNFVDSGGNSFLVLCNGAQTPLLYNGTTLAVTAWTGITQTKLTNPLSYKGRLYFVEVDSLSIWYGATGVSGSSSAALTEFNISSIVSRSGKIVYHGSWSHNFGNGLNDYYAIVTSEGEFLVYGGAYPGDTEWSLLTRGTIPKPISNRCFARFGNDILFLSQDGEIYSFTSVVMKDWKSISSNISNNILNLYTKTGVSLTKGWSIFVSQGLGIIFIVIPVSAASGNIASTIIYVGNLKTITEGYVPWSLYSGIPIQYIHEYKDKIYASGFDGYIYEIETAFKYDYIYLGANLTKKPITTKLRTAPVKILPDKRAQVLCVRPLFVGNGAVRYSVGVEADCETYGVLSVDAFTASFSENAVWDTSKWDTSKWAQLNLVSKKWRRVYGVGNYINLRMEGQFVDAIVQLGEFSVGYKQGGF